MLFRSLRDVEELLNWYGNSGRYGAAMRLLTEGRSAFGVYAHLARAFRAVGVFDASRSEAQRREALFLHAAGIADVDAGMLADALRFDALRAGVLPGQLPPYLIRAADAQENEADDALLRRMCPQRSERRAFAIARFEFDVVCLLERGEIARAECRLRINLRSGGYERIQTP